MTPNGPENLYGVPATIIDIVPNVKISFRHLSKAQDVCVEINSADKIKIQNKFGDFLTSQEVALAWLRRHVYVGQIVDINAVLNDNVWTILLIKGEFRMQKLSDNNQFKISKPGITYTQ